MFRKLFAIALPLVLTFSLLLGACAPAVTPEPTPAPLTFTDGLGRTVTLTAPAQRVISLAPSNTEIVFALGAGGQLVGRDDLSNYPPEALEVQSIGGTYPNVNASYNEDTKEITYYDAEHLGFAVDTDQGLLSPVIHNAGDLSLAGLARAIADLAKRTRSGGLKPDELAGGTFTITNIGSQGALFDTPILVPPQAAMLGTGAIVKRPVVVTDETGNESIGVRSMCYLPLTYDHRLIDGADAGRFLKTIKHRLEEAAFEADLGL